MNIPDLKNLTCRFEFLLNMPHDNSKGSSAIVFCAVAYITTAQETKTNLCNKFFIQNIQAFCFIVSLTTMCHLK